MVGPDDKIPNNLHILPPRDDLAVGEMLSHCVSEATAGVLVSGLMIGLDGGGTLLIRTSQMSRKDALWLLELARQHVIGK